MFDVLKRYWTAWTTLWRWWPISTSLECHWLLPVTWRNMIWALIIGLVRHDHHGWTILLIRKLRDQLLLIWWLVKTLIDHCHGAKLWEGHLQIFIGFLAWLEYSGSNSLRCKLEGLLVYAWCDSFVLRKVKRCGSPIVHSNVWCTLCSACPIILCVGQGLHLLFDCFSLI